jgi:acyl-CoA thioester hydrolase
MKKRIYYHDTDCGGVVYYANYLKYMEEGRVEFFEERGISLKELAEKQTLFVVIRQEIDYKTPAFYGDILEINTSLLNISRLRLEFLHEIKKEGGQVVCLGKTFMACVDKNIKPKAIDKSLKEKLAQK